MSKNLIVKSYEFVEARYKLTPAEAKLVALLIGQIEKDDKDFKSHSFYTNYLLDILGLGEKNHHHLERITENLMSRILKIKEEDKFIQVAFLSSAVYHEKEGLVNLQFDPVLKPYLLELKEKFIKYRIENILSLRSFYSIRFYELLVKWEKIGSFTMSIKEIRRIFNIKDNEYKLYTDLKRNIVLTAQKELEETSELYFTFKEFKPSRKVIELQFFVIRKNPEEKPAEQLSFLPSPVEVEKSKETFNQELLNRLTDSFALSEKQSKKILAQYDETYVIEILNVVEKDYKEGKVKKIAPYLLKALEDDFRPKKTVHEKEIEHKKKGQDQKISKFIEEKEILKNLETDFRTICNEKATKIINELPPEEINKSFPDWLVKSNAFTFKIYQTKGIKNLFVRIELQKYVTEKYLPAEEQDFITYARSKGYKLEKKAGEYKIMVLIKS